MVSNVGIKIRFLFGRKLLQRIIIGSSCAVFILFVAVNKEENEEQIPQDQRFKKLNLSYEDQLLLMMNGPIDPMNPFLVSHIKNKMLHPPSLKPYHLKFDEVQEDSKAYYNFKKHIASYLYITPIIQHLLMNQTSGFFIEAGAMDGEFLSNTLSLEKDKEWTGLLIEPDTALYKDLLKKNRKSWSINTCISTNPYPFKTYLLKLDKGTEMGMYSRVSNSLIEARGAEARQNTFYSTYEEVQCVPLQTILKAINVTKVDFFSLDVEDVEEKVLENIPFAEIEIESLVVEHRSPNHILGATVDVIDNTFIRWFNKKGYSLYTFTVDSPHNYFFIRNGSRFHDEAFANRPTEWDPEILIKNFN